ncbi:MAG: sensor histidine kinase [Candidatus Coproplasma sp.]
MTERAAECEQANDGRGENEMKKRALISDICIIFCAVALCAVLAYLIFIAVINNVRIDVGRQESGFETVTDLTCTTIEDKTAPAGVVKEYRFVIGDSVDEKTHIAFYTTHQCSETYIDGEFAHRISVEGNIKTPGSNWVMIPLSSADCGKEVVVRITPVYKDFIERKVEFLIGNDLAIFTAQLKKDLPQITLSALAIFIGSSFIVLGSWWMIKRKSGDDLAMLGLFAVMVGIWRMTDMRFTAFIFSSSPIFAYYLSIFMLLFCIIPFIRSIRPRYNRLSQKIFDGCCIGAATVGLCQLVLQVCGVFDIREILFVTHIVIIVGVIVVLANAVYDKIIKKKRAFRHAIDFLPLICLVGAIFDIIDYYVTANSSGLVYTLGSFILYALLAGIFSIKNYGEQGKRLAEQEKELYKSRVNTMMSQIKPHFLYNSLSSISELCLIDPNRARDALMDFSAYLRRNMDSIDTEECVHFSNELKHVETYLNLEKMRFGDRLNIVYDIEEQNFFIPPLTVQPLIENAVKHGISAKEEGGTVTLATRREGDKIIITVSDDGVGFDVQSVEIDDGRTHIGIRNIQKRLEMILPEAGLFVHSEKGKGTTVTVEIDAEKALP